MSKEHIMHENETYFCNPAATALNAEQELNHGLDLLNSIDKPIATIYGSHKVTKDSEDFKLCHELAGKLAQNGFAIATGGGSGIMEAANSAAHEHNSYSIALRGAAFRDEQIDADIYTHTIDFRFIFARRFILSIKSDALIVFPGGYGTLDELFELLVLIQSKIIESVPVVLIREEYWAGLFNWLNEKVAAGNMLTNGQKDIALFDFANTADEALKLVLAKRDKSDYHDKPHTCDIVK